MFPPRAAGDIEAEIIMSRQVHKGSFLLVEGPDDSKFWRSRVCDRSCELVQADGKENVLRAIQRLDSRRFAGALGLIDDDCDGLEGCCYPSANLIATDARDMECLLLRSSALERVLSELGDQNKIKRFQDNHGLSVQERLLENGLAFGRLRWLSKRHGLGFKFDKLKPDQFIDRILWQVNYSGLIEAAALHVELTDLSEIHDLLDALPTADPWYVCQGHDLVKILKIGLQTVLGNLKPSYGEDSLAKDLRLAFHAAELATTQLYADIRGWEQTNIPYRILPVAA